MTHSLARLSMNALRFHPLEQIFLALPEREDFVFVAGRARLLQPVDFPL